jgi:hypothetical protein
MREELKTVREDNERILKTQEELNAILLEKLCNQNTDKNKGQNSSNSKISQPKKKERKLEYPESEIESVYKDTKDTKRLLKVVLVLNKEPKRNLNNMMKSWENLRRLNHQPSMGKWRLVKKQRHGSLVCRNIFKSTIIQVSLKPGWLFTI